MGKRIRINCVVLFVVLLAVCCCGSLRVFASQNDASSADDAAKTAQKQRLCNIRIQDGYAAQEIPLYEMNGQIICGKDAEVCAYAASAAFSVVKTTAYYGKTIKKISVPEQISLQKGRQKIRIRVATKKGKNKTVILQVRCPYPPRIAAASVSKHEVTTADETLTIRMDVRGNVDAKAIVRIVSDGGETVFKQQLGNAKKAQYRIKWDLKDTEGDTIWPGKYEIRFYLGYKYAGKTTYVTATEQLCVADPQEVTSGSGENTVDGAGNGAAGQGTQAAQTNSKRLNHLFKAVSVGDTFVLSMQGTKKKVTFKSSDRKVAVVNQKGLVLAKGAGSCKIIAKVGSQRYTCKIRVTNRIFANTVQIDRNIIWFGDSRSMLLGEYLYRYKRDRNQVVNEQHVVALNGAGYFWAAGQGYSLLRRRLQANPNAVVIFNFGVNDAASHFKYEAAYMDLLRKMQEEYPRVQICIMSINPVFYAKDGKFTPTKEKTKELNEEIDRYNAYYKENRPKNVFYIDTNRKLEFVAEDGVHYSGATYGRIKDYVIETLYKEQAALLY